LPFTGNKRLLRQFGYAQRLFSKAMDSSIEWRRYIKKGLKTSYSIKTTLWEISDLKASLTMWGCTHGESGVRF
jgi:hypothetical protein|tara:strand:+ start:1543 stop:1761 length:219 start_codon:yes stop_codon:yes gene_type:complete